MPSLREIPFRYYLRAFLIYLFLAGLAFSTRWAEKRLELFEIIWDPIPVQLFYPGDVVESQAVKKGRIALWDSFRGFGSPMVVPSASTLSHPFKLFGLLVDGGLGFEFVLLLRLVLAGFFTYVLARGIGLKDVGGLLAGASYMFCGYFREFLNFQDLYVSMFYPLALLFLLRFFRSFRLFDFAVLVWVSYFLTTGGHPEAVYFYLAGMIPLVGIYSLLERAFSKRKLNAKEILCFPALVLIIFFFPQLWNYTFLPFFEFFAKGWSYHPAGLGRLHFDINHLIALFCPIFDFWLKPPFPNPSLSQFVVIPAYIGFFSGALFVLSFFQVKKSPPVFYYFWIQAILILGIIFGLPLFNIPGYLPLAERFQNFRYLQPIFVLSSSVLAGLALEKLEENKKWLILLLAVGIGWLIYHLVIFWGHIWSSPKLVFALFLIIFWALVLVGLEILSKVFSPLKAFNLKGLLFCGAVVELFCYFIFTSPFYGWKAFEISKPDSLEKMDFKRYRFYSPSERILPPNTAELFQMRDLRERGPLYLKSYFHFISALNGWKNEKEAIDAFLEKGRFYLPLELEKISDPSKDLLFKYLLLEHRLGAKSLIDRPKKWQAQLPYENYLSKVEAVLDSKKRKAILLHPPSLLKIELENSQGDFVFEIGLDFLKAKHSDGAEFIILSAEPLRLLFYRYLSPSESKGGWREFRFNLSEPKELELITLSGPKGDKTQDFALFGSLEILDSLNPNYKLISNKMFFCYERKDALPRFFSPQKVKLVSTNKEALEKIKAQGLSKKLFWVARGKAEAFGKKLSHLAEGEFKQKPKIKLIKETTDLLEFELDYKESGWFVLLDSYFSGWKAFLDDKEVRIFPCDYMFRAVWIPSGRHRLKMSYQPASFQLGIYLNLAGFLFGIFLFALNLFRQIKRKNLS